VTASRLSDEALVDAVTAALQQDPYILSDHVSVTVAHGVVTIRGQVREVTNLFAILRLARRIAGDSRVVDQIEFDPYDEDGN
jgi:osmotically-inducible protein OsmY